MIINTKISLYLWSYPRRQWKRISSFSLCYQYNYFNKTFCLHNQGHLTFMENPIIRIAAKFQYKKIPSLRTVAVMDIISWSRGRPQGKGQCTFLQRSWSRKAAVDVKTFLRPYLRNWCWKPFTAESYYYCCCQWCYLLLVYLSSDCPLQVYYKERQLILLHSATVCYYKVRRLLQGATEKGWGWLSMPVQNSGDHSPGELAMLRRLQYRTPESYHNSRYVQSHNLLAIMVMVMIEI